MDKKIIIGLAFIFIFILFSFIYISNLENEETLLKYNNKLQNCILAEGEEIKLNNIDEWCDDEYNCKVITYDIIDKNNETRFIACKEKLW